jgi:hypothetical protein
MEISILRVDFYALLRYRVHYPLYALPLISSVVHTFVRWACRRHVFVRLRDLAVGHFYSPTYVHPTLTILRTHHLPQSEIVFNVVTL